MALCGSPHCDEVLAELRDHEPFGEAGLSEVVVRPGYAPTSAQPAGIDGDYLAFTEKDASGREIRSTTLSGQGRTLGPAETVYVRCRSRSCLAVTTIRGRTRWAHVSGHLDN
jgi:hypothetical protein